MGGWRPYSHVGLCQLKIDVDHGGLTPDALREALGLRGSQIKRFLVENRNAEGGDELIVLLGKVSSHDIASFPEKLKELDGVRDVTIIKKRRDQNGRAV